MQEGQRTFWQELDPRNDLITSSDLNRIQHADDPTVAKIAFGFGKSAKHIIRGIAAGSVLALVHARITGESDMTNSIIASAAMADVIQYAAREVLNRSQR